MGLAAFFAVGAVFMVIVGIIGLAAYIFNSLQHQKVFKKLGYANAWMAWIPFAFNYALADIACPDEGFVLFGKTIEKNLFKFYMVVLFVASFVPVVGGIVSLVGNVYCTGFCYNRLFAHLEQKSLEECKVVAYCSGFCPIIAAFKFMGVK